MSEMAEPLNWDEFRIVRAIAEAQSLSGAAELLGRGLIGFDNRFVLVHGAAEVGLGRFDPEGQ